MIKARNKKVSLILVVAMLMTMFAGLGVAGAANTTYTAVTVPSFTTVAADNTNVALGVMEIKVDNAVGIKNYDVLTISLPSSVRIAGALPAVVGPAVAGAAATDPVYVEIPNTLPGTAVANALALAGAAGDTTAVIGGTRQSIDIRFNKNMSTGQGLIYVHVLLANVEATEDLTATIMGSNGAVFPMQQIIIGKVATGTGGTNLSPKSLKTIGSSGGNLDILTLIETQKNTLKNGNVIKLKLPNGFGWTTYNHPVLGAIPANATPNWAFSGYSTGTVAGGGQDIIVTTSADSRTLQVALANKFTTLVARATTGRIDLAAGITVLDDSVAKLGEVSVNVSGTNVTDQDVPIANFADYGVTVKEDVVKDVIAGWDQTLIDGSFKIVEAMGGSLLSGRTVSLTLPEGVKWNTNAAAGAWPNVVGGASPVIITQEKGTQTLGSATTPLSSALMTSTNNGRTLKLKVGVAVGPTKTTMVLKKFQVSISPDFAGELKVDVAGDAGLTGSVKIANVNKSVSLENDGKAEIIIGSQGQAVNDILIKESKKEAIDVTTNAFDSATGVIGVGAAAPNNKMIVLNLPEGASWTSKPTVTVSEGDVTIDTVNTDARLLKIKFKSSSTKPATIKIADIKVTTNRTVPEGDFKIAIIGESGSNAVQSMAISNNVSNAQFNLSTISSIVIGQCVTPATGAAAAQFKINSNIYTVNGVAKVMDAAPYIKAGRTYVPIRFLGLALGVPEKDIVWDEATQKVTMTLGDKKVELTIGSTTITVNGEAKTMDVAPEISNGRTMLPARYVAEGLGFQVGWDASTGTVIVSK